MGIDKQGVIIGDPALGSEGFQILIRPEVDEIVAFSWLLRRGVMPPEKIQRSPKFALRRFREGGRRLPRFRREKRFSTAKEDGR